MRRTLLFAALALLAASVAVAAPARLTEPEVRGFVARQSQAWNAAALAAYFALFTPDATFTDQGRARDGRVVPYGTSTLGQARAQARRTFATARVRETTLVRAVDLAPDGRSARIEAAAETVIATAGGRRRVCAERIQTIMRTPRGLRSTGQIDTIVRCR